MRHRENTVGGSPAKPSRLVNNIYKLQRPNRELGHVFGHGAKSDSDFLPKLQIPEAGIRAAPQQQLGMATLLDHTALF